MDPFLLHMLQHSKIYHITQALNPLRIYLQVIEIEFG